MRRLWQVMSDLYGHRWVSNYGADAGGSAGQTWAHGLRDLTGGQLAIGVGKCAQGATADGWPPTLPQFRELCLDVIPFAQVADDITRAPRYRHPFTRMVWAKVDGHLFGQSSQESAERMLRRAYDAARIARLTGAPFPPEPAGELAAPDDPAPTFRWAQPETVATAATYVEALFAKGEDL